MSTPNPAPLLQQATEARTQAAALRRLLHAAGEDQELRVALATINLERFGAPLDNTTLSVEELREQLRVEETEARIAERDAEIITRVRDAGLDDRALYRCGCGCKVYEHLRSITDDGRIPCRTAGCPCEDFTPEPAA